MKLADLEIGMSKPVWAVLKALAKTEVELTLPESGSLRTLPYVNGREVGFVLLASTDLRIETVIGVTGDRGGSGINLLRCAKRPWRLHAPEPKELSPVGFYSDEQVGAVVARITLLVRQVFEGTAG